LINIIKKKIAMFDWKSSKDADDATKKHEDPKHQEKKTEEHKTQVGDFTEDAATSREKMETQHESSKDEGGKGIFGRMFHWQTAKHVDEAARATDRPTSQEEKAIESGNVPPHEEGHREGLLSRVFHWKGTTTDTEEPKGTNTVRVTEATTQGDETTTTLEKPMAVEREPHGKIFNRLFHWKGSAEETQPTGVVTDTTTVDVSQGKDPITDQPTPQEVRVVESTEEQSYHGGTGIFSRVFHWKGSQDTSEDDTLASKAEVMKDRIVDKGTDALVATKDAVATVADTALSVPDKVGGIGKNVAYSVKDAVNPKAQTSEETKAMGERAPEFIKRAEGVQYGEENIHTDELGRPWNESTYEIARAIGGRIAKSNEEQMEKAFKEDTAVDRKAIAPFQGHPIMGGHGKKP
jgi:hypothetical protein